MDDEGSIETFRTRTLPVFADCPDHPVAVEFLDWLERERPETVGLDDVGKALGRKIPLETALWTLSIMTSTPHAVFDAEMHYRLDDGTFAILSEESASILVAGGTISDPATGFVVADAASRTHPRFRLRGPAATRPNIAGETP